MRPETLITGGIGIGGTTLAFLTPDRAAMAAGCATTAWILWQLGCSIYDRCTGRRRAVPAPKE